MLAPHFSALSIGEYLGRAGAAAATAGLPFSGIESWAIEPAYVSFVAAAVRAGAGGRCRRARGSCSPPTRSPAASSTPATRIPTSCARRRRRRRRSGLGLDDWGLAWQSAGRTPEPWLGPDVLEIVDALAADRDVDGLLVCPCGFVADHLEVLYDLDIEAAAAPTPAGSRSPARRR